MDIHNRHRSYEICVNGTAYTVCVDEDECISSSKVLKPKYSGKSRHKKSYAKWLKQIKAVR